MALKKRLFILVLLLSHLICQSQTPPVISGWTVWGGGSSTISVATRSGADNWLRVTSSHCTHGTHQYFNTVAGTTYTLGFDLNLGSTNQVNLLIWDVTPGNTLYNLRVISYTGTADGINQNFVAGDTRSLVQFRQDDCMNTLFFYLDNIDMWTTTTLVAAVSPGDKNYRYGFNGKEKDNEIYGKGNAYDFGARIYSPMLGTWLSPDPMTRMFPSWSPYVAFNNNPVYYVDPTGMAAEDWVKDKKTGTYQYDPNIKSQGDIEKYGQADRFEYVGETFTEKTAKGTAEYRKDGSIFFSNRTEGYNRIWNNSNVTLPGYREMREHLGYAVDGGLLVLPDYKNNSMEALVDEYGYKVEDGKLYDPITKKKLDFEFSIHSHPNPAGDPNPSNTDRENAQFNHPYKPAIVIAQNGEIWGVVGNNEEYTWYYPRDFGFNRDDLLSGKKELKFSKPKTSP